MVCHGGDHYAGKFPEDGSGAANVGGHFLPYDTGNFEFSSKLGLRAQDQEGFAETGQREHACNRYHPPIDRAEIPDFGKGDRVRHLAQAGG